MDFEFLTEEATADLAIKSYGKNLKQAFENSAKAVIHAISNIKKINDVEIILVKKKSDNLKMLLFEFLEEILFLQDTQNLIFNKIKINELNEKEKSLSATFYGEQFDSKKHEAKTQIKAITYFDMNIKKTKNKTEIKFLVDL